MPNAELLKLVTPPQLRPLCSSKTTEAKILTKLWDQITKQQIQYLQIFILFMISFSTCKQR